jgi:hypothetical protein
MEMTNPNRAEFIAEITANGFVFKRREADYSEYIKKTKEGEVLNGHHELWLVNKYGALHYAEGSGVPFQTIAFKETP